MKKLTISIVISLISYTLLSQVKEKELSNAETFSNQSGSLIEKQFIPIGKIKGVEVSVMKIKDLNSNVSKSALRFEYEYKSQYTTDSKIAVLDNDEIEGLVKSMNNMIASVFNSTRTVYTEVNFMSRTGFKAGCYFDVKKASNDAPSTKNEKFYVETKETMFEGKSVNKDEKGTYIWKAVTTSPTTEPTGNWKAFVRLEKHDTNSQIYMSTEDFKTLFSLVEQAKAKL